MTWSYSGDPSASLLDEMRFILGDTTPSNGLNPNNELLQNEEINYALNKYPDFFTAAVVLCEAIIAKFTRMVDEKTGDEAVTASQRAAQYRNMAADLRQKIGFNSLQLYAGGASKTENEKSECDTDRVKPQFDIGLTDNPYAMEEIHRNRDDEYPQREK